jgi:hypothetical protein
VDPRGPATASLSPLEALGRRTGEPLEHLLGARRRTAARVAEARAALAGVAVDPDVTVVLMGSWGRGELTSGSDDDVLVIATAGDRPASAIHPAVEELRPALRPPAGEQGIFNRAVSVARLANIGLDADDNANTTRRLLLLLESAPLLGAGAHRRALAAILDAYLAGDRKDRRPPRFLLNDIVRYWRTICVDFEGKARDRAERKWALRHAKLRTSRAMLFAGGLLPVLECHHVVADEVPRLLLEQFSLPPTDRLASAFLAYDAADAGARAFGAYDRFLALIDEPGARAELERLGRDEVHASAVFQTARRLGREIQQGLLALLFEREPLRRLIRQYGVF